MFLTQEFCSMACIALLFVILCYLIKMHRVVLHLGMNHQQALTEDGDRTGNRETINDRTDLNIRHAIEHDERES